MIIRNIGEFDFDPSKIGMIGQAPESKIVFYDDHMISSLLGCNDIGLVQCRDEYQLVAYWDGNGLEQEKQYTYCVILDTNEKEKFQNAFTK